MMKTALNCLLFFLSVFLFKCVHLKNVQLAPLAYSGYYVSPSTQFFQGNAPANGYPASTWPLYPVKERIAQTYVAQDVQFGGHKNDENKEKETSLRLEGVNEDDVENRFNLGGFAGQVAASAVGTVVGNAGVNLAGNFLNRCNNRGKRSILMHKIEKRQALESNKKNGNPDKEPEVVNRIIPCPQDFLGQGGGNGGRYCNKCRCNQRKCHYECRKCSNVNNGWNNHNNGWSNGNHQNNRPNNNWSNNHHGNGNNWSNSGNINCQYCNCRSQGCWNTCLKCHRNNNNNHPGNNWGNNNNYPGNSWGNHNGGWRNDNSVSGRLQDESKESLKDGNKSDDQHEPKGTDDKIEFGAEARNTNA